MDTVCYDNASFKKELVAGKFMVLAIFCAIGSLFGLIIGFIGGLITHKIVLDIVGIGELLFLTLVAWVISLFLEVCQFLLCSSLAQKKAVFCY